MKDKPFGIEYVCEHCDGSSVTRDAWAEWDGKRQSWELSAMFDFAFCHACHRATRLIERRVDRAG
jgi:hypothetical protein